MGHVTPITSRLGTVDYPQQ